MNLRAWQALFKHTATARVKGGVLQLTLGIGIVVCMLGSAMIMFVYYNKLVQLDREIEQRLADNATSGIHYVMASRQAMKLGASEDIDLFQEETDTVTISRKPWGIFEVGTAQARRGNKRMDRVALLAAEPDAIGSAALYVPDNQSPLYLTGDTRLAGTAYLSERKFSTGYINNKGFKKSKFIEGTVKKSDPTMAVLDTVLLDGIKNMITRGNGSLYMLQEVNMFAQQTQFPFTQSETPYYYSEQSIALDDSLSGNLIIHSAMGVHIGAGAALSDIIVIAPVIDIDRDFEGSIQCFASRAITVGPGSKLRYPSALVLMGDEQDSTILIRQDAQVEGVVIIRGYDQRIGSKGLFKIEKGAVFHGMAYINGATDVRGSVYGHLMTRSFVVKEGSTEYAAHLLDAVIDGTRRSPDMPGTLLWATTKKTVLAKWIR